MPHQSAHVRLHSHDGIATLFFSPPAGRVGPAVLRELLPAVAWVADEPGVQILLLRSGTPMGFGRGVDVGSLAALETDADAARWVQAGQDATAALAALPVPSVAYLEGPTVGPGLELALACDYRLAVAGPDSWVGFGDVPCGWGGWTRLARGGAGVPPDFRITPREAVRAGVFDHAFCERRGKIELRTWLDRLQRHPRKRAAGWRWWVNETAGLMEERKLFRAAWRAGFDLPPDVQPIPLKSLGLIGDSPLSRLLAAECSMRGVPVVWAAGMAGELFTEALRRGRVTPLEAEQAKGRIKVTDDADAVSGCELVSVADPHAGLAARLERELLSRSLLAVPPAHAARVRELSVRPGRVVGLEMQGETVTADHARVRGWLAGVGISCRVGPASASLAPTHGDSSAWVGASEALAGPTLQFPHAPRERPRAAAARPAR